VRVSVIKKAPLRESDSTESLKDKTPQQLLDMMWQLALDAWSFKENISAEPRLQRHVVVLKRRGR
jgi:hypothetical protein